MNEYTGDILARPKFVGQKGQLSIANTVAMYEALSNQVLCCCSVRRINVTNLNMSVICIMGKWIHNAKFHQAIVNGKPIVNKIFCSYANCEYHL